jgi:hypothetical protein
LDPIAVIEGSRDALTAQGIASTTTLQVFPVRLADEV